MTTHSKLPRWAQAVSGICLMSVALAAGGLSLYMNVSAGLGIGLAVAIAFGLSDLGKIMLPIVCQAIGWTKHLRAAYVVASVVSVVCAVCYLADRFGTDLAGKENASTIMVNADQRIRDLRSSLETTREMAANEARNGGCGSKCQKLTDEASKLQTALSEATAKREGISADKVDGKASIFATVIGYSVADTSRLTALVLIGLALLASELFAHTAGAAASIIGEAMKKREAPKPVAKKKRQAKPRRKTSKQVNLLKKIAVKPDGFTKAGQPDRRRKATKLVNDNEVTA